MSGLRLIASYPKSGNTWLRAFLASHLRGGQPIDLNADLARIGTLTSRSLQDLHAGLEHADLMPPEVALLRPLTSRRIAQEQPGLYKTHDSNLVPPGAGEPAIPADAIDRAVYIVRDPRDVAISAAHHFGWSLAVSVDRMADASFRLGHSSTRLNVNVEQWVSSWSAHVESWLDAGDLHLLPLRYEDLLADPLEGFTQLCRFLELDDTRPAVGRSLEACSFSALAGQETRTGFRERYHASTAPFFRAGGAGGWRTALAPELAERLVAEQGRVMARLGYR
ncbi:sulfotransferase domain-containing protein [Ancylobacter rudongensis]|uniref:Sulfotransferase domain-containing protein n=1 Tax=Ancylobacter rudongensis TaxID=177413 RepID=A0A1G4QL54_9HYPH|nr:sulfotransferase domain-containing protein [Ancylobacter rudongensis]SCW45272.1 Sulfotransferase domain-containing protein [Ancylobacter rudongensis]